MKYLYIYIRSIWPQMVVEHHWRSTWRCPLRDSSDAPLGGCCGETTEQHGSVPTNNIPAHLSRHPNGIPVKEPFYLNECTKMVRRYDTTHAWGSTQLCESTKSRKEWVRPILEKDRVCIFVVLRWDDVYLPCDLPNIYSPLLSPPPSPQDLRTPGVDLQQCTWRPWSSGFGDVIGDWDWVNSEMQWEAVIERVWTCTWRPRLSELRDALGGRDQASLEMNLQTMIERDWSSTWRRSILREARQQLRLYSMVNL